MIGDKVQRYCRKGEMVWRWERERGHMIEERW